MLDDRQSSPIPWVPCGLTEVLGLRCWCHVTLWPHVDHQEVTDDFVVDKFLKYACEEGLSSG